MRRFLIISICILCFLGGVFTACFLAFIPPSGPQAVNRDGLLELNGVTIVRPGIGQEAYRTIRVADGRIVAIHESVNSEGPYAKMFVTPGLIDMHAHLPPDNLLKLIPYFSLLYLSHGVTTLRIAGDLDGTATPVVREAFAKGTFAVPRVYSCDRFVTAGKPRWKNSIVVNSPDDAPAVIQELIDDRADCMKLYENLTIPMIRSLVSEARKAGLPVIGHVPTQLRYEDALIPDVQHFFGVPDPASLERDNVVNRGADWMSVDDERMNQIVQVSIRNGIANTPTLVTSQQLLLFLDYDAARRDPIIALMPRLFRDVFWNPFSGIPVYRGISMAYLREHVSPAFAKKKELVLRLYQAGAQLHLGTDVQQPFVVPGASMIQEMRLFAGLGIPVPRVWKLATVDAGKDLGLKNEGEIIPGAPADLLIFRKDPTVNLANMDTLEAVVVRGRMYRKSDIDEAIRQFQNHFESFLYDHLSIWLGKLSLEKQTQDFDH